MQGEFPSPYKSKLFLGPMAVIALLLALWIFGNPAPSTAVDLVLGQKYQIIRPVYLVANYKDRGNKTLSKETAEAFLLRGAIAKKSYTAFQTEVPAGTVMTVLSKTPRNWQIFFHADSYFVKLDPGLSQGLDVQVSFQLGLDGDMDGMNPEIFRRMD